MQNNVQQQQQRQQQQQQQQHEQKHYEFNRVVDLRVAKSDFNSSNAIIIVNILILIQKFETRNNKK